MNRTSSYLRYLIERGAYDRYGPLWSTPERLSRIDHEFTVISDLGFEGYFIILADIVQYCRDNQIPYGPGRGSVGGSFIAYLVGITEVDSLEWELIFERFLTHDRIGFPDVDLDFSQERRQEVIDYIRATYERDDNVVLQVAAFARSGGRSVIDHMLSAHHEDPDAGAVAAILKKCLPPGNITGGTKQSRELAWWLEEGHGDRVKFREVATKSGWLDSMLKLDGMYTHLARHAAGVVILHSSDQAVMPTTSADGDTPLTGYDMYDLDRLGYLKIDVLGLRTLDVVSEAHRFSGGSGGTNDLMKIWSEHRDDPEPYELLQNAESLGIFQMETAGYRRTLKSFQPNCFEHVVQLNALYRPGALDYTDEDTGLNMVDTFIERRHGRDPVLYRDRRLEPILSNTHGVILYQEQAMRVATDLAGFSAEDADKLRKAIGKKKIDQMDKLKTRFMEGCASNGVSVEDATAVWDNIAAAARYSWNKSHAVAYAIITWFTIWFKYSEPAAFYAALFNSYDDDKDRMSGALGEARQKVEIGPPDINIAESEFKVREGTVVFGLNGIRGLGEANRALIAEERLIPFGSYSDFCLRLPSIPISIKLALVRCGAFDQLEDRKWLLSYCDKTGNSDKKWTVAEHINHNRTLKTPRPVPDDLTPPEDSELASGEYGSIGFYIKYSPFGDVEHALKRTRNCWGGEVQQVTKKKDKNGNDMAMFTLLEPEMTRKRVVVFSSVWNRVARYVEAGSHVLLDGKLDGDSILLNRVWQPEDLRHFTKATITDKAGATSVEKLPSAPNDKAETVAALERSGYKLLLT